jgi:hypothetical protein
MPWKGECERQRGVSILLFLFFFLVVRVFKVTYCICVPRLIRVFHYFGFKQNASMEEY